MWLSVVTHDLVALRAAAPDQVSQILLSIQAKKNELSGPENDGQSLPEFSAPTSTDEVDPTSTSLTVKRSWSTQAKAQEFADFVNSTGNFFTATIEQQV